MAFDSCISAKATATAQGREDTANAPRTEGNGRIRKGRDRERKRAGEEVALGWT